jgi:hypothetical protein
MSKHNEYKNLTPKTDKKETKVKQEINGLRRKVSYDKQKEMLRGKNLKIEINENNDLSHNTDFSIRDSPCKMTPKDSFVFNIEEMVSKCFFEIDFNLKAYDGEFKLSSFDEAKVKKICENKMLKVFNFEDNSESINQFIIELKASNDKEKAAKKFIEENSKRAICYKDFYNELNNMKDIFVDFLQKVFNKYTIDINEMLKSILGEKSNDLGLYKNIEKIINEFKTKIETDKERSDLALKHVKLFLKDLFELSYKISKSDTRIKPRKNHTDGIININNKIKKEKHFDMPLKIMNSFKKDSTKSAVKKSQAHYINSFSPLKPEEQETRFRPINGKHKIKQTKLDSHRSNTNSVEKILIIDQISPTESRNIGKLITLNNSSILLSKEMEDINDSLCDVDYESAYANLTTYCIVKTMGDIQAHRIYHNKVNSEKIKQKYLGSFLLNDEDFEDNKIVNLL